MRTIKFRAWHYEKKEMMNNRDLQEYSWWTLSGRGDLKIDLMIYTGLKDKNGKEIYEGDILREQVNSCVWKFVVGTRNGSGNNLYAMECWRNFYVDDDSNTIYEPTKSKGKWMPIYRSMEIIGNIHEEEL